ncbi:MAG: DUF5519 family protein [Thermoplasmata archaeon]|nr:DUF5519 family protein [Thermoplasmata archaeon]
MLREIPGLEQRASRYGDGLSYFVGEREIAHFHGDSRMDVRLTREAIRARKREGTLDPRVETRGSSADWISVAVGEPRDIALALELVEEAAHANF